MISDAQLLGEYRAGSQAAFAELVRRHIDWVYSSARRRVGDAHLAEDVTQAVFIALARSGPAREGVVMSGWLFTVMRYASAKVLRGEARRRNREAEAARRRDAEPSPDSEFLQVLPFLEQAVDRLNRRDRQAILLRFYQQQSFTQVAAMLGVSEEAARKRVSRAVMKLRQGMHTTIPAAILGEKLFAHSTTAAPSGLAATVAGASLKSPLARDAIGAMRLRELLRAASFAAAILAAVAVPLGMHIALADGPVLPPTETTQPAEAIVTADSTTRPTEVTLDKIIAGVKTAEGSIQNLYIKGFETTEELLPKGASEWVFTSERFTGSAWYDAEPRGKTRIYFSDEIMPWKGGTAPFAEQIRDMSWDGKEVREVRIASGAIGTVLMPVHQVGLSSQSPVFQSGYLRWETGVGCSLQYLVSTEGMRSPLDAQVRISAVLEQAKQSLPPLEITGQTVNGFDAVRVRLTVKVMDEIVNRFTYWFDPKRGYALVKYELVDGGPGDWRTDTLDVKELKEIAPGVWFPLRASISREDIPNMGQYRRYNYHAVDAVANDPHFDPAIFQATIPVGYLVNDQTSGKRQLYVVMPDGTKNVIEPGNRLPYNIPVSPATRPDGDEVRP
ncbi:MAG: sigma-70 family RNA polymerase sigma factor [Tepidisphaeraceae bacterium]|jgi:RNA polymerase sigma factor (sigma-70 family)